MSEVQADRTGLWTRGFRVDGSPRVDSQEPVHLALAQTHLTAQSERFPANGVDSVELERVEALPSAVERICAISAGHCFEFRVRGRNTGSPCARPECADCSVKGVFDVLHVEIVEVDMLGQSGPGDSSVVVRCESSRAQSDFLWT